MLTEDAADLETPFVVPTELVFGACFFVLAFSFVDTLVACVTGAKHVFKLKIIPCVKKKKNANLLT
jgi:hypothetical protein